MKRLLDFSISAVGLIVLAPVLGVIALAVRWRLGGPVLFRQVRPGLHGRPFTMYKFRTMRDAVDEHGRTLPDSKRLTGFGRLLRSTSLDELPELWNVLRGEMSLVGPRPLLMEYLPLYTPEQARRQEVRPGITGWAQVNGRNEISWEEKFELDVWYVDNKSVWLDLKILLLTVKKVFVREGISQAGQATMQKFRGTAGPEHILIWGAGGHGKVVADVARALGYTVVGYVDADPARLGRVVEPGGAEVVLMEEQFLTRLREGGTDLPADTLALAIGSNEVRLDRLREAGDLSFPVLSHPTATISPSARIGRGTVVMPRAVINANARIGEGVIVNTSAIIEHDCVIGDGAHISPGAVLAGGVHVGAGSWVGAGAVVIQGVRIGANVVVGAGAVVIRDLTDGVTAVGVPARPVLLTDFLE